MLSCFLWHFFTNDKFLQIFMNGFFFVFGCSFFLLAFSIFQPKRALFTNRSGCSRSSQRVSSPTRNMEIWVFTFNSFIIHFYRLLLLLLRLSDDERELKLFCKREKQSSWTWENLLTNFFLAVNSESFCNLYNGLELSIIWFTSGARPAGLKLYNANGVWAKSYGF